MKSYLITTVAAFLTLFLGVSAQGVLLNDYTTLDVPGASYTEVYGIDGGNIIGTYYDDVGRPRGFLATIPEPTTMTLLAIVMLAVWRRR